jgi:cytoplasmic iron level regulating protein YaaA (DUF328/UPF0246 family)
MEHDLTDNKDDPKKHNFQKKSLLSVFQEYSKDLNLLDFISDYAFKVLDALSKVQWINFKFIRRKNQSINFNKFYFKSMLYAVPSHKPELRTTLCYGCFWAYLSLE